MNKRVTRQKNYNREAVLWSKENIKKNITNALYTHLHKQIKINNLILFQMTKPNI
jgi:hypothetical protein